MKFFTENKPITWTVLLCLLGSFYPPSPRTWADEFFIPDDQTLVASLLPEDFEEGSGPQGGGAGAATSGQKVPQSPQEGSSPGKATKVIFQTDLFTGQATIQIPFPTPPGRQGIEPDLTLIYHSGNADSWVGPGWSLELGMIERSTKHGVPNYDDSRDTFVARLKGVQGELVHGEGNSYRLKKEEAFWRIRYIRPYWELTTKDGTRFFFGLDPGSRQENVRGTFAWALSKVQDLHGNTMTISYSLGQGQLYLREIRYTGFDPTGELPSHRVVFTLEDRPVTHTSFISGAKVLTAKRLKEIAAFSQDALARRYLLEYDSTHPHPLARIIEYGSDGVTSLPPMTFSYYNPLTTFADGIPWTGIEVPAGGAFWGEAFWGSIRAAILGLPGAGTTANVDLRDMDADALPDRVLNPAPAGGAFLVQRNTGSRFAPSVPWTGVEGPVVLQGSRSYILQDDWLLATYVDLMDMNGDGRPDRVLQDPVNPSAQWRVQLNTGTGFAPSVVWPGVATVGKPWWSPVDPAFGGDGTPLTRMIRASWLSGGTNAVLLDLLDMNGDGLPDRVIQDPTTQRPTRYHVQLNTGSGFAPPLSWLGITHPGGDDFVKTGIRSVTAQMITDMVDMNGDRLLDRVMQDLTVPFDRFHVQLNNGNGFEPVVDWVPVVAEDSRCNNFWRIMRANSSVSAGGESGTGTLVELVDLNGDRLPDRVLMGTVFSDLCRPIGTSWYAVQQNTGQGFLPISTLGNVRNPFGQDTWNSPHLVQGFNEAKTVADLFDVDGNGLPDRILRGASPYNTFWVQKAQALPSLLREVNNGIGGVTTISYRSSASFQNTGSDGIPDLPFPVFVVEQASVSSGLQSSTTRYAYADGAYDPLEREFRGFGHVTVTDSEGNLQENWFHQDPARVGKLYRQELRDAAGALFSRTENTWSCTELAPRASFCPLTQTDTFTYDGDDAFKQTRVTFRYDPFGNEVERREEGNVTVRADERTTRTEYAVHPTLWLVDRMSRTITLDASGNRVTEQQRFYDHHPSLTDPPTRGLFTKQADWLSTGPPDPVQRFSYDPFGNQISVVDARGGSTSTTFDSILHTYPTEAVNPLGHQTRWTYDPKTGEILTATDPNGQTTTNVYDPLGRVIQVIGPLDTPEAPGILYEYALDSVPIRITKRARLLPGGGDFFVTHTFYDGLDRVVEVKAPAEDPERQIASGIVTFDGQGNVKERFHAQFVPNTGPRYTPLDTSWPKTVFTYDAANRKVSVSNPDGTVRTSAYQDWAVTETDENGHVTRRTFDAYQRLVQVEEFNGNELYATTYAYDSLSNLLQIRDARGNLTRASHDSLGRRLTLDDPDRGSWSFAYDLAGNLIRQTDAKGQTLTFSYDALNRATSKRGPDLEVAFVFDERSQPNRIGRLSQVIDGSGSTEFFYDLLGREIRQVKVIGGSSFAIQRTYDALDRATSLTYPDGETIRYTYNGQGQVETIVSAGTAYLRDADYSATQQRTHLELSNGVATNYTYDPSTFRLARLTSAGPPGPFHDFTYTYDRVGNVTRIQDGLGRNTQDFLYDNLDRLTLASGPYGVETYAYDSIANRTEHNGTLHTYGLPDGTKPHALTAMASGGALTYDASGNLLTGGNRRFTYDAENRLTQVTSGEIALQVSLNPGWNFLSLPIAPTDTRISQVLSGLTFGTEYDQLSRWNPDTQTFEHYVNDPAYNQFDTFEYGKGYEIFVTNPNGVTLTLRGREPPQSTLVNLKPTWSLIGAPTTSLISIEQALNPLVQGADYHQVARYNPVTKTWEFAPPQAAQTGFSTTTPWESYFLEMIRAVTWVIPSKTQMVSFTYDGQGNRVRKMTATTTTRYLGDLVEQEVTVTNTLTRNRIFLDSSQIAVRESHANGQPAKVYFLHSDHLGSTSVVTDEGGQAAQRTTYLPYGSAATETGSLMLPQKFTGKRLDTEIGLYDFGARAYDPALARFLTPDIAGPDYNDPQTLNPYAYTRNNPVKLVDPTGETFWWYLLDIVGTASDIYYTAQDTRAFFEDPSAENLKAVGRDIGLSLTPFVSVGAAKLGAQTGELLGSVASRLRQGEFTGELSRGFSFTQREAIAGGRQFERKALDALGLKKNTKVLTETLDTSRGPLTVRTIPDINEESLVGDIKNVRRLNRTRQLQAQAENAQRSGRSFALVVSEKLEHISKQLQELLERFKKEGQLYLRQYDPISREFQDRSRAFRR